MKVLHLPYNIANWASINTKALNAIDGIEAKALVFGEKSKFHDHEGITYVPQRNKLQILSSIKTYREYIKWADVLHWYYDDKILPLNIALKSIHKFNKPAIVEWLGSDIRNPLIDIQDNPYFEEIVHELYSNDVDSISKDSIELQRKFGKYGFCTLTCSDLKQYLIPKLYKSNFSLSQRINIDHLPEPKENTERKRIRICHAPSSKKIKGTEYVISAVERLKNEGYEFEFDLIHNVNHEEAINRMNNSDVFIDQLILGGHGMAALEALSLNKLVLVYLKDYALNSYPKDHPLINVNPSNLYSVLQNILENFESYESKRNSGRIYVNKYHSTEKLIPELIDIYEKVISLY